MSRYERCETNHPVPNTSALEILRLRTTLKRNGLSEMKLHIREIGSYGSRIFEVWTNVSAVETSVYLNSSSNRCFFISLDRRNSWILFSPEIKNRRLRENISSCEVREDRRNSHDDSGDGIESIATIESAHAKG